MFRKKVVPRCRLKKHISPNNHTEWKSFKLNFYFCTYYYSSKGEVFLNP